MIHQMLLGVSSPKPVEIERITSFQDGGNRTTYTYTDAAIGPAYAKRRVLVFCWLGLASRTGTPDATCTVNGVPATRLSQQFTPTSTVYGLVAFISAEIPTGTTATIVVSTTGSGTFNSCMMHPFIIRNLRNTSPVAVAEKQSPSTSDRLSTTVSPPPGGFIIGVGGSYGVAGYASRTVSPNFGGGQQDKIDSSALYTAYVIRGSGWNDGTSQVWLDNTNTNNFGLILVGR